MKIAHIIWAFNIGGAESMLVDIINEQSKFEEVHLIIVNCKESIKLTDNISKNVTVHRMKRKPGSRNIYMTLLANIKLWRLRPDVMHFHNHDLVQYYMFSKWQRAKLFLTVHNTGIQSNYYKKYDKLFAISNSVKQDLLSKSNLSSVMVYNGIRTDIIRMKKDYSSAIFRMVQVGRLDHEQKGQDIFLHAIEYLVYSKNIKNISVDFIGDGPSANYLLLLANKLDISDYCNFIGTKKREWIYEHLCEYNLLVQPSRYEGFGLTVAEALAAKVPVLVSNLEGPMEIISDGKYGYSFMSENIHDLAEKITKILKEYSSIYIIDIIEAAYAHVVKTYDIKETASNYLSQYKVV